MNKIKLLQMKNKMSEIKTLWEAKFKRSLIYWKRDLNKYPECRRKNKTKSMKTRFRNMLDREKKN